MSFICIPANKSKVYYGIPPEPDLGVVIEEENEDDDDKDKPKVCTWSSKLANDHFMKSASSLYPEPNISQSYIHAA